VSAGTTLRPQAASNRPAMATALPWQWFQAPTMAPELRSGAIAGRTLLVTLVMTIVATKVTRISWRSQRRNAFDVEFEAGSTPDKPLPSKHRGTPE
ncbi:hypothetical protein, partial [Wenzhouxiangella sp. XN79A]|uniref:hypothetical protein n=1 Tax=Wenzhouxiangella sp. XN79A TaxID=2724193 RepID=UPI001981D956